MTGARFYITLNGIMFLVFGAWCLFAPEYTSTAIGYVLLGDKGVAEYTAVYGGLQAGIGMFYLLTLWLSGMDAGAILFSRCLYGGLVIARSYVLLTYGSMIGLGWMYFVLEIFMLVGAFMVRSQRATLG